MSKSLRQRQPTSPTQQPLTATTPPPPPPPRSILTRTLQNSGQLANLLPTGTLLAFQLLTPMFTHAGSCDNTTRPMTAILLTVLSLMCFLASFTDSVKGSDNQVYYGLVTFKGLWLCDCSHASSVVPDLSKYRLRFMDAVHAFLSVVVFVAVALRDRNVVSCFYPTPGNEVQEVLDIVPIVIGLVASLLFVVFPTTRHGIGFPVSQR